MKYGEHDHDDTIWERTHRLGGWLFVVAGVTMLVMDFFESSSGIVIIIGPILVVTVILTAYSFLLYRRLNKV
jgi:uncharacterized membrane protein